MDASLAIPFLRHPRPNLPHPVGGHGEPPFQFCLLCHCLISSLAYIISPTPANVKHYFASPQNKSRHPPPRLARLPSASIPPSLHLIYYSYIPSYHSLYSPFPIYHTFPYSPYTYIPNYSFPCLSTLQYIVASWHIHNGMSSGRGAAIPAHSLLPPNPSSPLGVRGRDR
jgi:hypothetical protein